MAFDNLATRTSWDFAKTPVRRALLALTSLVEQLDVPAFARNDADLVQAFGRLNAVFSQRVLQGADTPPPYPVPMTSSAGGVQSSASATQPSDVVSSRPDRVSAVLRSPSSALHSASLARTESAQRLVERIMEHEAIEQRLMIELGSAMEQQIAQAEQDSAGGRHADGGRRADSDSENDEKAPTATEDDEKAPTGLPTAVSDCVPAGLLPSFVMLPARPSCLTSASTKCALILHSKRSWRPSRTIIFRRFPCRHRSARRSSCVSCAPITGVSMARSDQTGIRQKIF